MNPIYSFDIFDTVLVRTFARPSDLFLELAEHLSQANLLTITTEEWCDLRQEAETIARTQSPTEETTLQSIYHEIANQLNWSQSDQKIAQQLELDLEKESLYPIPETQKFIQMLHQQNQNVLYISDMYLSAHFIREILQVNHLWKTGDSLYVSSEIGLTKFSGNLFRYCLEKAAIKPQNLVHQGDNFYADVQVAKKLKIKTNFFNKTQVNRYEQKILQDPEIPKLLKSKLVGSSRISRLQANQTNLREKIIWETSSSGIAPVLFGFVYWCLREAQKLEIKRLYFVARDGQILLKIAQIINEKWFDNAIECRYLYGSRQAWHSPALTTITESELDWIFDPTSFLSVHSLCQRVNLNPLQIQSLLVDCGLPEHQWNQNLTQAQKLNIKQIFIRPDVTKKIIEVCQNLRDDAIDYLKQEGLADNIKFALIDIGWSGRLQSSLSKLLTLGKIYPEQGLCGFYFALSKRVKARQDEQLIAYFCDPSISSSRDNLCIYRAVFEMLTAADHGSTIGFKKQDDQFVPILRSAENTQALDWGLKIHQNAIVTFTNFLTDHLNPNHYHAEDGLKIAELLLQEFIEYPSIFEAEAFGSFCIAEDQNETILYELAPKYNLAMSLQQLITRKSIYNNAWIPAMRVRSSGLNKILTSYWARRIVYMFQKRMHLG